VINIEKNESEIDFEDESKSHEEPEPSIKPS